MNIFWGYSKIVSGFIVKTSIDIAISPSKGAMFLATTDKGGEQMAILKYNVSMM
jgi:hypothetical protein